MLPVQSVLPSRLTPWCTLAFIAAGVVSLLYQLTLPMLELRGLALAYGLVPSEASGLRAILSLFIYQDLIQGVTNLWALWIFGDNVEDRLAPARYVLLLVLSGLIAAMVAVSLDPSSRVPLVGPAGAIAGVIGAHLSLLPRSRVLVLLPGWRSIDLVEVPSLLVVAFWLLFQGMSQVGSAAAPLTGTLVMPLTGFAVGAVGARLLCRSERRAADWWNRPSVS